MSGHVRGARRRPRLLSWFIVPALAVLQFAVPVTLGALPSAAAATVVTASAPVNVSWNLAVVSARAEPQWPGADGGIAKGAAVSDYQWLITADDSGNPADPVTKCTPTDGHGASSLTSAYSPGVGTLVDGNGNPATDGSGNPIDQSTYCQWPSVRYTPGAVAVQAQGTGPTQLPAQLRPGKYLISVSAGNFKLGGQHFTVPAAGGPLPVQVPLDPYPLPLGTLRLRVFEDTVPVDGTYEVGVEPPLSGFGVHINDVLGEVTTDFYGNRLCTNYRHFGDGLTPAYNVDGNHPLGAMVFDGGTPVINAANPGGTCRSDANGDVAIPNLGPNRYTTTVVPPSGQKWYQTTTLEGNHDWDMWIAEGDTGYDNEQTVGGEPVPNVDMGFVPFGASYQVAGVQATRVAATRTTPARTTVTLTFTAGQAPAPLAVGSSLTVSGLTAPAGSNFTLRGRIASYNGTQTVTASTATSVTYVITGGFGLGYSLTSVVPAGLVTLADSAPTPFAASNAGSISGVGVEINTYVGGTGGVTVPNAGVAGANVRGPINQPIIALSDLGNNDQMVYIGRGGADGKFTIPHVPDGSYQLTMWDYPQDMIIDSFNVDVAGGKAVNIGQKGLVDWYTDVHGTVFLDKNGNGRRDAGESGVPKFALTFKERDNSMWDQGQNVVTTDDQGNYDIREAYPATRWSILEAFNTSYKTTGVTVQADNDPTPSYYPGSAVDINVLPVIGLSGRVDWGVQNYSGSQNGGIVGTVTYDTTRNELDPRYAFTESYQPGIPGLKVHLYAPVPCTDIAGDPTSTPPSYASTAACNADGYWHYPDDPTASATETAAHAPGSIVALSDGAGNPIDLYDPYTSETWQQPTGCTARLHDGQELNYDYQLALPPGGDSAYQCVEAPMSGWQAKPSDASPDGFGQTVNGNYGFGTINHNPETGAAQSDEAIPTGDYIVKVDIPSVNGQQLYQVTKEEDINVFTGDARVPVEGGADVGAAGGDAIAQPPGDAPVSQQPGVWAPCVGANHTVDTSNNPDLIGVGDSPFKGQRRPLCDEKLVTVHGGQSVAPNFNLFTPVPLPTHFWGLTINDLGLSQDKTQAGYGEAQPLPGVPMGIYDWSGRLLDTVTTDYNGMYEATEPSTSSYNCPLPAGPCPGMYYFKGNDPGQPGHPNQNYNPRFRTIGTDFQAWPGLFTATDTAPTQVAQIAVAPGSTTINAVDCSVNAGVTTADKATPDIFNVSTPYMSSAGTTTTTNHPSQSLTVNRVTIATNTGGGGGKLVTLGLTSTPDAASPTHNVTVATLTNVNASGLSTQQRTAVSGIHQVTATGTNLLQFTVGGNIANTAAAVTVTTTASIGAFTTTTTSPGSQQVTITGVGFGAQGTGSAVTLTPGSGASNVVANVTSWSDTSIVATVTSSSSTTAPTPGAYQLSVTNANGRKAVNGLTFHVRGGSYNPTLIQVNPPPAFAGNSTAANTFRSNGTVDPNSNPEIVLQSALNRARALGNTTALVVVWPNVEYNGTSEKPANPNNPTYDYFENIIVNDNTKIQGVGPGGFIDANTFVRGTRLNGLGFNPDNVQGSNWVNQVTAYGYDVTTVPDSADVTVLGTSSFGTSYPAALDGFTITGGSVADFPTNLDTSYGGTTTPVGGTGALVSQGGGIYLHGSANNMQITNNVIVGNSGAYAGAVRVGTPYAAQTAGGTALMSTGVKILNNQIRDNGGTNLAGGIGVFDGSTNYVIDHNNVCGNFSAEYGGGISHYGSSGGGRITANRIYLNGSYDEGGGVMIAGELNPNLSQPSAGAAPANSSVTVDGNLLENNLANDDGGGLRFLQAGTAAMNVTNNMIVDNISTHEGGGVALDDTTNVRLVGNTVMKNITTATAATSNGSPAPAGLSTAANSVQLQNTLPSGSALYSKPSALKDNIFWDNRAGTWNTATTVVDGVGNGGAGDVNVWDMGSIDPLGTNLLDPTYSILSAAHPQVTPDTTNKVGTDPQVKTPFDTKVIILTSRVFPTFREAVIVANAVTPDLKGDYHLTGAGSPASNAGQQVGQVPSGVAALMALDYDRESRPTAAGAPIEIGADEIH